mmetsp:Transcript_16681/g.24980  ORF Transcript_16681/g.24980 Transcript_16681/m.24980 type:complete len:102 (-) Transcript_16681:47-352(-)
MMVTILSTITGTLRYCTAVKSPTNWYFSGFCDGELPMFCTSSNPYFAKNLGLFNISNALVHNKPDLNMFHNDSPIVFIVFTLCYFWSKIDCIRIGRVRDVL